MTAGILAPPGPRAERGALRELGLLGGDGEDAGAAAAAAAAAPRGGDPGAVGEAELKRAYRRLALRWHPDKQARGGAAERAAAERKFQRVAAAYALLAPLARAGRLRRDGGADDSDDTDGFDDYCDGFAVDPRSDLWELFKAALLGADVEAALLARGVHRPPENFGVAPFPAFDAPRPAPPARAPRPGDGAALGARLRPAAAAALGEERDCFAWCEAKLRALLAEIGPSRHGGLGCDGVRLHALEGEAALVGRVRGGHTIWYPAYELSATLAVRVALEGGRSVTQHVAVPHLSEDNEEEEIEFRVAAYGNLSHAQKRAVEQLLRAAARRDVLPRLRAFVAAMKRGEPLGARA